MAELGKSIWNLGTSLGGILPWVGQPQTSQSTQSTQQTQGQTQQGTSGQQSTGGTLPWVNPIKDNPFKDIQDANKVQLWSKVKATVSLPWVSKPTAIIKPAEEWLIPYEEWLDQQYEGQTFPLIKWALKDSWNNIKKFWNAMINNVITSSMEESAMRYEADNELFGKDVSKEVKDYKEEIKQIKKWKDEYIELKNKEMEEWRKNNLNQYAREDFSSKTVLEMIRKRDWRWLKYGITEMWAQSLAMMFPTLVAWAVTRDPTIMWWIWFASSYPHLYQEIYEESRDYWLTPEQAELGATLVWSVASLLEVFGFEQVLWKFFIPTSKISYKPALQIFKDFLLELWEWAWTESLTEASQELLKNLYINLYNDDKDVTEWVLESGAYWGILWLIFGSAWSTISAWKSYSDNKKIDMVTDIEALNYVMGQEERKNQRMSEEQKEKVKERIKNRRNANTWWEVEEIDNQIIEGSEEQEIEEKTEEEIEEEMIDDVLNDEDEDIWDSKYQKNDSSQSVSKDTVSEKSHSWNITITSENSSGINQNLNGIKRNTKSLNPETFLQKLKESFTGAKWSNYIKVKINGRNYVMRISNHHANANTSLRHPQRNTSIVIKLMKKWDDGKTIKFKKNNKVNLSEFVYDPANLDFNKMNGIIDGIQNWMQTGEYNDTNFDKRNESIRKKWNKKKNNKTESGEKHQLKYEEEWYTPWVANKKEKSISGKEWIKQKNTINDETIEQLAEKYWVKVEVIKWMIEILKKLKNGKIIKDWEAYWKYRDQLLTLSEQIKESTAPHELLHAIFDMIDPETKVYLISQVMKSEGWNAETAEERLADSFSNFFRTGKIEWAPKSTWWRIKIFFKRVRSFINGMNKWRNELEEIFTDIITADGIVDLQSKIDESSSLNKSKERMRKRFMEYRKNAIKTQERAESENKYQKTWKNEKNEYTNGWKDTVQSVVSSQKWDESIQDVSFFSKTVQKNLWRKYLKRQWELYRNWELWESNVHKWDQFSNVYDLWLRKWEEEYLKNFNNLVNGAEDEAEIWKIKIQDKTFKIILDVESFYHLFRKHWDFNPNNLITTANHPDYKIIDVQVFNDKTWEFEEVKDKINLIKILDDNRFLVVWANLKKWYYIATHFEIVKKKWDELIKLLNRWKPMDKKTSDYMDTHFQLAWDINSEAFKKRFGDSKVVDKDGNPLVVYHGTRYDIKIPNMKKWRRQAYGGWMYFTTNKQWAEHYANEKKNLLSFLRKPRVMEVYLSIQNPIKEWVYKWDNKWIDELKKLWYEVNEEYLSRKNVDIFDKYFHLRMLQDKKKAINFTEDFSKVTWYDGLIAPQSGGEEYWVAFKPSQVKSATDNVGTYDANNDDIRYQKADSDQKDNEWRTLSNGQAEYFKDSKVRDKNGNLLKVYHGTNSEYTVYDSSLLWAGSWDLWFFWDGWYFATHKWEAWYYGRNIMEWYLNITNPFYYGNMTKIWNKDFGSNAYVTIRNLWKIDESINNMEMNGYKVSEIWDMVDDYLNNVKLEKLNDEKDPYNGWEITYWKVTEYWKSEIKTAMKWLSENGMLDEQLNHYMMDKVWYLKPRDLIEEITDEARFDKTKKSFSQILQDKWYDGIVVWDNAYQADEIVAFRSNEFKNVDNLNPTDNEDIRYQRVYHWSPYDFDKFDSSHMWEWEWWQAHGWWHYVAVDKQTGKRYAENYWYISFRGKRRWELSNDMKWTAIYKIIWDIMDGKDKAEAIKEEKEYMLTNYLNTLDETYKNTYDFLETVKPEDFEWNRNLYDVEIPDIKKADTPTWSNYLEEKDKINKWILNKFIELAEEKWLKKPEWTDDLISKKWWLNKAFEYEMNHDSVDNYWEMYNVLWDYLWSDKEASKFLESLGYDGIHYFWNIDWESYVIFNDDALEIKNHERYQRKDSEGNSLSEWQIKYFENSKIRKDWKLLVVYHWTHWDFTIFDRKKIWSKTNNKWIFWEWFYFTSNKKYWDYYAQPQRSKEYQALEWKTKEDIEKMRWKTMRWYLNITNPFYWRSIKTPNAVKKLIETLWLKKNDLERNSTLNNQMRPITDEKKAIRFRNALEKAWYDWIIYEYDGADKDGNKQDEIVAFYSNQFKNIDNKNPTYNDDIRYQKTEYDYDENGNRKWIKFWEDNSEFDPSIFWENTKEEQIEEDKENEKSNPFYNAWMKYNNQNYKDDQLTLWEFVDAVGAWWERKQEEFDKRKNDIAEVENDPKMLELQLKAVKLAEEETNVGKKFWKNVSKEVRDRQQAEVEKKREDLSKEIFEWMYPWLKFEEATYDDTNSAWNKEAEWEMLGREKIEEKLKYFKKDQNGNWEKKNIKLETPQEQREKIEKSGNFDEVIAPSDRVIEWKTPEWQKGRLDKAKDPKQFKKVMEKINSWKSKTKVELKDVTNEVRALERYKENEKAEKERRKKEKQEEYAKKKQEEYKRNVRLKAFQRLVDMQRFEKYPFLSEDEIKQRWWFTDEEWKKITEQLDLWYPPKKRNEKAVSDFNKAVDSEVKFIIEGLSRQNKMKQKEAEKNLGEIWDIDLDVLLGKDEEKWQKEVEEFERIAKEEKGKSKKEKNKRLEQAREDVTNVEIDKERENSKSEKERVDKIIKSTKTDKTVWWSIKESASDLITPVSTRIREISPKIYRELMKYFQNKDILTNQRLKEIDPFLKALWKIRKENPVRFMDIWVALANRNIGYANGLLQEYWVKVPTKLLDTIYDEVEDVGLNMNYLGSYYPLSVKSPKSFLEELMKVDKWDIASEIEKKIQEESVKKGWPLDESEVTAIINSVIAWEEKWPDVNLWNKHMKKRNTEIERTPQMLDYCDDPISTLITYVEWMTDKIERAKFLWKSRNWNVHTLADYVYNVKNGLEPTQQDELMELLKSVFNDASPNIFYQTWRDIATLTTLWSPSSTLTQISDLSFSVYENGWREALKAVWDIFMKRKAFDLQDMWVINRWEEYTNINSQKNIFQKAIHNVFKLTFFSKFDTFGKSTFIQSTWNKRRKRALKWENGDPQLRKDIMKWTVDEYMTDKIINDLRNWVFSEEVAMVMYMKLGNVQPLTKAQMPKAYLDNPRGRLFYQFKTFGIKQMDYVVQETKENLKWFKNLSTTEKFLRVAQIANMVFTMTLFGLVWDELKDITMRRKSNSLILRWLFGENVGTEQVWDKTWDNILKLFGLSRYSIMQMKNGNWDKAISDIFLSLPAMRTVDNIASDLHKAFKNDWSINLRNPSFYQAIPVIWKYRYWIYWGGQDKQQEALDKEKKTTTSGWSSRSTRTTRKTNRNTRSTR